MCSCCETGFCESCLQAHEAEMEAQAVSQALEGTPKKGLSALLRDWRSGNSV